MEYLELINRFASSYVKKNYFPTNIFLNLHIILELKTSYKIYSQKA